MQPKLSTINSSPPIISTILVVKEPPETNKILPRRFLGLVFTVISSISFSLSTFLVKLLTTGSYSPFLVGVWRFQGILWPSLIILIKVWGWNKTPVFKPHDAQGIKTSILLCCRWLFGTTAILLQFLSLQYISVADSLVITVITPVFVTLVAHKVLGEKCGFIPILCAIVTVLGVGVMTRPSIFTGQKEFFDGEALIGISFALASMVCTGISFVLVRYLRTIHFSVMMTFFGVWGTMECGLLSVWYGDGVIFPEEMKDSVLALLLAVLSFISQGSLVLGLKFEQASMVAVFRTLDVLFGFVWQGLLLGVVPDVYSVVGGITVTVGVLVLGFRKWLIQLPEGHKARNLFYLILK